ncbi:hypothetical protein, partial [Nocardia cyriacigeorgica]|uniref:hypothetical protein n=1 Tax=Nocardia cyriacigeorgica TaxID=135487 RepID=UPI003CC7F901
MQLLGPWTDSGAISASAGGKARGLHILHNSGFAVPEWAVLGTDVFDAFATGAGLDEQIAEFAAADTPEAAASAVHSRRYITLLARMGIPRGRCAVVLVSKMGGVCAADNPPATLHKALGSRVHVNVIPLNPT